MEFRTILRHERDAVLDLLKQWCGDRELFARYFRYDPGFRDDLCFVAVDEGRIVSTLQVFRRRVRIRGAVLEVGGVGNVFTAEPYRERGLASELLGRAIKAMDAHGFDLSLLFALRLLFYSRHGWRAHVRHLLFIDPADVGGSGSYAITPFTPSDLATVMDVYETSSAAFSGPTVRDPAYWHGQLCFAGNPDEDFLVARASDRIVAYMRGTPLYDFYQIIEHACLPGHEDALTQLVCCLHGTKARTLPGTITQLAIAPTVRQQLQERGLAVRTVEDVFWMWQIISPERVAVKLGMQPADLAAEDLLFRLLPPEQSVYWIADRF
ncbi:MAG TPA: GNAT family N-acetyltransferase [Candidatus Binatia bacterium]|jgi:GNAT superfamily N-acetyltransferase